MRVLTKSFFNFTVQQQPNQPNHYTFAKDIPQSVKRTHMNMFQAINSAIDIALETDHT